MKSIEPPIVTIIIVTYNSQEEIVGCLDSIFKNPINTSVFVVDNASSDGTCDLLKTYSSRDDRLNLILNDDNVGLAAANNQPLPFIKSKFTLILNPDILLRKDSLQIMVNAMEADPQIGMLGPLCLFEEGKPHVSAYSHYNIFTIITWRVLPHTMMRLMFDNLSSFKKKYVLFVSGACYMIPTNLYKELGGYDSKFFLTISDVADIGMRIKKRGLKAIYYPNAVITHFSGRSNAPLKFLTQYWGLNGDMYFIKKHKGSLQFFIIRAVFVASSFFRGVLFKFVSWIVPKNRFKEKAKLYLDLMKSL